MARTEVESNQVGDGEIFPVDLSEGLLNLIVENKTAGWHTVILEEVVKNESNKISITSKFEKQKGFVSHKGFIKGCS